MALLTNETIPMGTPCPPFSLPGVDGNTYSNSDFAGAPALVVMFICNHCPYVQAIEDRYIALAKAFTERGVAFVGICANDPDDYPDDAFDELARRWREKGYGFPYLQDLSQEVARSFGAVCTPDLFVYDKDQKLAYHGQLDDNWKEPQSVTREDLKEALEQILAGQMPTGKQEPARGCSIKWRN